MRVSLLITCLVDAAAPRVGEATVRLLRAAGHDVTVNLAQTCCGQPAWNSGFAAEAATVARTTLEALEADLAAGADAVVVPAGSCAAMVKVFWPELFDVVGDHDMARRAAAVGARTHELTDFLAQSPLGTETRSGSSSPRPCVVYHHSCHMLRELHLHEPPIALLERAGCEIADWPDSTRCCGFGGLFSVKLPELSGAMADTKLATVPSEAVMMVGSDSSCLMHLAARATHERGNEAIEVRHIAEVLAERLL